jgi:hypothetical protein
MPETNRAALGQPEQQVPVASARRIPPRAAGGVPLPRATAAPADEDRVIHGMTAEERKQKGFTPMRLFASRSTARFRFLGMMLERTGHDELAQSIFGLVNELGVAHQTQDENQVAWGDLLTRQSELMDEVVKVALLEEGTDDNKFFRAMVGSTANDIEDAMSGNLESVDRKIGEEVSEKREKDEPNEQKADEPAEDKDELEDEAATAAEDGEEEGAGGKGSDDDAHAPSSE